MLDEGVLALVTESFDRSEAEVGGEFTQFDLEASDGFEGTDEMALEDVPEGDAEFPCHRHGGLVAAAPDSHAEAPLLQRIRDLKEFLGRLDEERAQGAAAMALQGGGAFVRP